MRDPLPQYPDSECACSTCEDMCKRPCWPSPEEAEILLEGGLASRLTTESYDFTQVLRPKHNEIGCVFWTADKRCMLHGELKPIEARKVSCKNVPAMLHSEIADLWETSRGRSLVARYYEIEDV